MKGVKERWRSSLLTLMDAGLFKEAAKMIVGMVAHDTKSVAGIVLKVEGEQCGAR